MCLGEGGGHLGVLVMVVTQCVPVVSHNQKKLIIKRNQRSREINNKEKNKHIQVQAMYKFKPHTNTNHMQIQGHTDNAIVLYKEALRIAQQSLGHKVYNMKQSR